MIRHFAAAALAILPVSALAGGYTPPVVETPVAPPPVVVETPVYDWSGFYLGAHAGIWDGEVDFNGAVDDTDDDDRFGYGAFAGYNHQFGNFVLGGELAYTFEGPGAQGVPDERLTNIFDAKARAGIAAGRALPYLFAGYTAAHYDDLDIGVDGFNYGVGVDVLFTERLFGGIDLTVRDLEGEDGPDTLNYDATTIGVRLGFKF